jgi:hypothetical protein
MVLNHSINALNFKPLSTLFDSKQIHFSTENPSRATEFAISPVEILLLFRWGFGVPKGRLFQFTIGSHSDQYETQNFTVQENWLVQFDLAGLKSVPCARLFAAFLKIGFVLFKMK